MSEDTVKVYFIGGSLNGQTRLVHKCMITFEGITPSKDLNSPPDRFTWRRVYWYVKNRGELALFFIPKDIGEHHEDMYIMENLLSMAFKDE